MSVMGQADAGPSAARAARSKSRRRADADADASRTRPITAKSPTRKVRTVPPSAIYEPPTPELDTAAGAGATTLETRGRARRPRRPRYYSSSSSAASDESDSDAEPPWWTLTTRGMQRLRLRRERERERMSGGSWTDARRRSEETSAAERAPGRAPRPGRRRNDDDGGQLAQSSRPMRRSRPSRQSTYDPDQSGQSTPVEGVAGGAAGGAARSGRPFRPASAVLRRMSGMALGHVPGSPAVPPPRAAEADTADSAATDAASFAAVAPPMQRSSSAPSSPVSPLTQTPARTGRFLDVPAVPSSAPRLGLTLATPESTPGQRRRPRRGMSDAAVAARATGSLTDSETVPGPGGPRPRARRLFSLAHLRERDEDAPVANGQGAAAAGGHATPVRGGGGENGDGGDGDDEGASPSVPRPRARRLQTHQLRLRLPPEMKQHFANGWPHAGSWQDALYNYDDWARDDRRRQARGPRASKDGADADRRRSSAISEDAGGEAGETPARGPISVSDGEAGARRATPAGTPTANGASTPASTPTPRAAHEAKKRTKSRRNRRAYSALVPPTPGGLGFVPTDYLASGGAAAAGGAPGPARARVNGAAAGAHERDPTNPFDRIDEELERQDTATTEKGSAGAGGRAGRRAWAPWTWLRRRRDDAARRKFIDELDWRARFRRVIFLDARVTVYLRVLNLAVIVTLLGLAIKIRLELYALGVPGLIGPSTTLIIAYASLTILHTLTAIYREYFGRPIGLWGLRSKMLWVCLDLLFVALWSSATSLAANDYIATPLECTPDKAWWLAELADYGTLASDAAAAPGAASSLAGLLTVPAQLVAAPTARHACARQVGCIVLSVVALALYGGNMVLSLFRIFETVRRTAHPSRAVSV